MGSRFHLKYIWPAFLKYKEIDLEYHIMRLNKNTLMSCEDLTHIWKIISTLVDNSKKSTDTPFQYLYNKKVSLEMISAIRIKPYPTKLLELKKKWNFRVI